MPRNAEVIRQWTILREIERARSGGVTIDDLASLCGVTTRTIRRDLQALEGAGFTLSELSALYFSRTLVESLAGTPFRDDVEGAFEKLASVLTPHMREFL